MKFVKTALLASVLGFSSFSSIVFAQAVNQSYESALERFYASDLDAAVIYLKNSLKNNPEHLPSLILMAEVYIAKGDGAAAEDELLNARSKGADERRIVPLLLEAYVLQQNYQAVVDSNVQFPGNNRLSSKVLVLKGRAYVGLNELEQAQHMYQEAAILTKNDIEATLGLAQVALLKNKYPLARNYVEKALAISPINDKALTLLSNLELQEGNVDGALKVINQILALNPENFPALLTRANLNIEQAEYEAALIDLEIILGSIPNEPKANYLKLIAVSALGNIAQAQEIENHLSVIFKGLPSDVMQTNPIYYYLSGLVSFHKKQFRSAQDSLDKYLAIIRDDPRALKLMAKIELALQNPYTAKTNLVKARLIAPNDIEIWTLLGQVYLLVGEMAKAEQYFIDVVESVPEQPEPLYDLARLHYVSGKHQQAISLLKKAKAIRADIEVLELLANAYQESEQLTEALLLVEDILTQQPTSSAHLKYKGVLLGLLGQHDAAELAFNKALESDPSNTEAFIHLVRLDVIKGSTAQAIEKLKARLASDDQENNALLMELGDIYRKIGNYASAREYYEKLYSRDQNDGDILGRLVGLYVVQKQQEQAIDMTNAFLKRNARHGNAHFLLADLYFNNKALDSAFEHYNLAVKYSPNKAYVLNQYALSQKQTNDLDGAILSLERAIAWNDGYFPTYINLIDAYAKKGDEIKAISLLDSYVAKYQDNNNVMVLKGELYRQLGKLQEAVSFYEKALKQVLSRKATFGLYRVLVTQQAFKKAEKTIETWLQHSPNDIVAGIARADLYRLQSDYANAAKYYQQLIAKYGQQPVFFNNLAQVYLQSNQLSDALAAAEAAYKLNPDYVAIIDTLAWIYSKLQRPEDALPLLREAIAQDSENSEVKYHLAVVLTQLNRHGEARRYLTEITLSDPSFKYMAHVEQLLSSP
ncbi:XrtA/PEP-CTERM system TPR-repeat protein PrsT [Thalassotalea fusca]